MRVPFVVTAVSVKGADAILYLLVLTSGSVTAATAVSDVHTTNTQIFSLHGAENVPFVGTAEIVLGTDQTLTGKSVATGAVVARTAVAVADAAVNVTTNAILVDIGFADAIAATSSAVLSTCLTVFVFVAFFVTAPHR